MVFFTSLGSSSSTLSIGVALLEIIDVDPLYYLQFWWPHLHLCPTHVFFREYFVYSDKDGQQWHLTPHVVFLTTVPRHPLLVPLSLHKVSACPCHCIYSSHPRMVSSYQLFWIDPIHRALLYDQLAIGRLKDISTPFYLKWASYHENRAPQESIQFA